MKKLQSNKRAAKKFIRQFAYIVAGFIILYAILISVARGLTPYFSQHEKDISAWLSQKLGEKVEVERTNIAWEGLHPIISFNNLSIQDKKTKKAILQIKELAADISVIQSVLHSSIVFSKVSIDGVKLSLHSDKDGNIAVAGFPNVTTKDVEQSQRLLGFLYGFDSINLQNVTIDWTREGLKPLTISNISMVLRNFDTSHVASGTGVLLQNEPTKFSIIGKWQGTQADPKDIDAKVYVAAKDVNFDQWTNIFKRTPLQIKQGRGSVAIWIGFDDGKVDSVQTQFALESLNLDISHLNDFFKQKTIEARLTKAIKIKKVSANIFWEKTRQGWRLSGDNIHLQMNGEAWPTDKFSIIYEIGEHQYLIKYIELKDSLPIIYDSRVLAPKLTQLLKNLNAKGILTNIIARHEEDEYELEAGFQNLEFNRWNHIPGAKGLSGHITIRPNSGYAQIRSRQAVIDFGKLFIAPQKVNNLRGDVSWYKTAQGLVVDAKDISGNNEADNFSGAFSLTFPKNGGDPILNLLAGGVAKDARNLKYNLPVGILQPNLVKWLNSSIKKAGRSMATVIFRGPVSAFPFDHGDGVFIVDAHVTGATLKYQPDWPAITGLSGDMIFDGRTMTIMGNTGKIYNANIKSAWVFLPRMATDVDEVLDIHGETVGDLSDGQKFLQNSPLQKYIGKDYSQVKLSGPMTVKLDLRIPISGEKQPLVKGAIDIKDGKIAANWGLHLDKINGTVGFSEDSIVAKNMKAELFNHPATISINKQLLGKKAYTVATVDGDIGIADVQNYLGTNFKFIQGVTGYQLKLKFPQPGTGAKNQLQLKTNLQGISVKMPSPFAKNANAQVPTTLDVDFLNKQPIFIRFDYGSQLKGAFIFDNKGKQPKFKRGNIHFGKGNAVYPKQEKLLVDGTIKDFNWDQWKAVFASFDDVKVADGASLQKYLRLISLYIGKVTVVGRTFNKVKIAITPYKRFWVIKLNSKPIAGVITYPYSAKNRVIKANFSRIVLNASKTLKETEDTIDSSEVPAMLVSSKLFTYGKMRLGSIYINLSPIINGVKINDLTIGNPYYTIYATGQWTKKKSKQNTLIEGEWNSTNIGQTLISLGYPDVIIGKDARLLFSLAWPGNPFSPIVKKLDGNLSLKINEGAITEISKEAQEKIGIGKLIPCLT